MEWGQTQRPAVPLAKRCLQDFTPGDRGRGLAYFREGRVSLTGTTSAGALASVRGTQSYLVAVDGDHAPFGFLTATCSCPRFDDGIPCKHLWATLLTIDAYGESWRIPGTGPLEIEPPDIDSDDESIDVEIPTGKVPFQASTPPVWQRLLGEVENIRAYHRSLRDRPRARKKRQLLYRLDISETASRAAPFIYLMQREEKKDGTWSKLKSVRVTVVEIDEMVQSEDRELLRLLLAFGAELILEDRYDYRSWSPAGGSGRNFGIVPASAYALALQKLCATGRLYWDNGAADPEVSGALQWDDGKPWQLAMQVAWTEGRRELVLDGHLRRGAESRPLSSPLLLLGTGLAIFPDGLARFDAGPHFPWVRYLRREPVTIPAADARAFVENLWSSVDIPPLELPPELRLEEIELTPTPGIRVRATGARRPSLSAEVVFDYDGEAIGANDARRGLIRGDVVVVRDRAWEKEKLRALEELGFERKGERGDLMSPFGTLAPKKLPGVVSTLLAEGWTVEAEGVRLRRPTSSSFRVVSGVDWLDLEGGIDFDGEVVGAPDMLRALRRKEDFVQLSDGSRGMLPEEWLVRSRALAALVPAHDGAALRFRRSQALLLDILLEEDAPVHFDHGFQRLREQLGSFTGIEPVGEPRGFKGELRPYQREGLGWLLFLNRLGFGGCLADDMGLGKTIQVLALLQLRKLQRRGARKPTLLVVPRSLVHNWIEEAARFVPRLRILDYSGADRARHRDEFAEADAVLTTYGVVRRDIMTLKDIELDYAILDEAQAIKNNLSQSAKACRLLRAEHRLALTGTPVENHLGDLWSIFQFLNPGMLGKSRNASLASSVIEAATIAPALRPFILRRTKQQVLPELPPKSEQTLVCTLERSQRKIYDELRRHYQASLTQHIDKVGLSRAKIRVLEALLRLRQAACHPGLLDPDRRDEGSAKLDTLLERVAQIVDEGHKALIFSQFTRFLAIVRQRLDENALAYEYLDGRTKDRKRRVDRFQNDPECRLFLVSLKAGGVGLNLTAADYVFLLDPWWNPATESQAIDRTHRIGQTRSVFAYRLIAEDTVEEKIVLLQQTKRELADAIVSEDNSLVRNLTAQDLRLLLS